MMNVYYAYQTDQVDDLTQEVTTFDDVPVEDSLLDDVEASI
jgi:hypothetical protein